MHMASLQDVAGRAAGVLKSGVVNVFTFVACLVMVLHLVTWILTEVLVSASCIACPELHVCCPYFLNARLML